MLDKIIDSLSEILSKVPAFVTFLLIAFVALAVFWRGCVETRKNRSSIFDMFLISSVGAVLISRISFIIINWQEFAGFIWYWLPYEKYGNDTYLFRLLPWRFLRMWDGGLVVFSLVVGFLLLATIGAVFFKKWRWRQMFFTIYYSGLTIYSLTLLSIGLVEKNHDWSKQGILLALGSVIAFAMYKIVMQFAKRPRVQRYVVGILGAILTLSSGGYISYTMFGKDLHIVDQVTLYIFVAWLVLSTVFFFIDLGRVRVSIEKLSSVRTVRSVDINQPIRLTK